MLERVPATAESAAHVFLRNIERPSRSSRLLDPRFWQHDCDQLATTSASAAWWPQYLQKIRQIPQARGTSDTPEAQPVKRTGSSYCKVPVRTSSSDRIPKRPYSVAVTLRSAKPVPKTEFYDAFGLEERDEVRPDNQVSEDRSKNREWFEHDSKPAAPFVIEALQSFQQDNLTKDDAATYEPIGLDRQPTTRPYPRLARSKDGLDDGKAQMRTKDQILKIDRRRLPAPEEATSIFVDSSIKLCVLNRLLDKGEDLSEQELDQVWRLFITLPDQETVAQYVFPCLARTKISHRIDRAIEALRLMPPEHRTIETYKEGIHLAFEQDAIQEAIELATVAAVYHKSEIMPTLYARLVDKELWSNLSALLVDSLHYYRDFADCAHVHDLPEKILRLCERLDGKDPTLENPKLLFKLSRWLGRISLHSESTVSNISADTLLDLLHHLHDAKIEAHTLALKTLSREGVRSGKKEVAIAVYQDFLSSGSSHRVNVSMLGSLLSACGASGFSPELYSYILDEFSTHLGKPDKIAYLLVLAHAAREGTRSQVDGFFRRFLNDHGAPPDIRFVSPLIHVCARAGDSRSAQRYFDEVNDKHGFQQDAYCWNMLLSAYARSSIPMSAFDAFEKMKAAGVKPDSYTYGTLMAVCADLEDPEAAQDLLVAARGEDIAITVPMIGALVDAFLSHDNFYKAHDFVIATTDMKISGSQTRLWNSLLRHCAKRRNPKMLVRIMKEMQDRGIRADSWTHATMLIVLTTTGKTDEAVRYLRSLYTEHRFSPSPLHYSIILHGLVIERNHDMVAVIQQEMKTRFSHSSPDTGIASLAVKLQSDTLKPEESLDLLASLLLQIDVENTHDKSSRSRRGGAVFMYGPAQAYINMVLYSLLHNNHPDLADRLVELLEKSTMATRGGGRQSIRNTVQYVTLQMDSALAQSNYSHVEKLWQKILQKVETPVEIKRGAGTQEAADLRPVNSGYRGYVLSKPLNRYMEAMARQKKQTSMIFNIERFESLGFKLSGINWNKYVQTLARSSSINYHIMAFKMTETLMLGRAQSWTLLRRGLLREKNTSYSFEKSSPEKPRPVLIKQNEYSAVHRMEVLQHDPARKIPTYTTMVYLARVLEDAQRRALVADAEEITLISRFAKKTKQFLERMPWLNDDIQGKILRPVTKNAEPAPQPQSDKCHQWSTLQDSTFGGATSDILRSTAIKTAPDLEITDYQAKSPPTDVLDHNSATTKQSVHLNATEDQVDLLGDEAYEAEPKQKLHSLITKIRQLGEDARSDETIQEKHSPSRESVGSSAKAASTRASTYRTSALLYIERRRQRKREAARQRREILAGNHKPLGEDPPQSVPQSAAAKRLAHHQLNKERRTRLLEDLQARDRPALAPLPDTKVAYRRRRRVHGLAPVRFVFDLNRSKKRHAVRSGKIPERRQGLAKIDQREYMVDKRTKHLLLDRQSPLSKRDFQVVRGKISPNKYIVKLHGKSHRTNHRKLNAKIGALIAERRAIRQAQEGLLPSGDTNVQPLL